MVEARHILTGIEEGRSNLEAHGTDICSSAREVPFLLSNHEVLVGILPAQSMGRETYANFGSMIYVFIGQEECHQSGCSCTEVV